MIVQAFCTSFKKQLLEGVHDFRVVGGDVFKIALYTEAANINVTTSQYTTTDEISGTGYTAGGLTLTNIAPSEYNLAGVCSFETATWAGASFSARGALIYNTTPAHTYTNPVCLVLDFGTTRFAVNNSFSVQFPQITDLSAIIRIN
tara:strand:- start:88 stop:525 length:438 start_codon:yes stop_codon:yes gene_type:complete